MKGWLVRRDEAIRGWIGDVYNTHAAAMADCPRGYEIVEVELPDPPVAGHLDTLADKIWEVRRLCEVALDEDDDLCVAFVLIGELCTAFIDHSVQAS